MIGQNQQVISYQNIGSSSTVSTLIESAELMSVNSTIPDAFTYGGVSSSSVTYLLTPYELSGTNAHASGTPHNSYVTISYDNVNAAKWISSSHWANIYILGYTSAKAGGASLQGINFTSNSQSISLPMPLYNVTGIEIPFGRVLPGSLSITVNTISGTQSVTIATFTNAPPQVLTGSGSYNLVPANVIYNQNNGQPATALTLTPTSPYSGNGIDEYYIFSMNEIAVPGNPPQQDSLSIGIFNSTGGVNTDLAQSFQINYSATGVRNNLTYTSVQGNAIAVRPGFVTEHGSSVVMVNPDIDRISMGTRIDTLKFQVT